MVNETFTTWYICLLLGKKTEIHFHKLFKYQIHYFFGNFSSFKNSCCFLNIWPNLHIPFYVNAAIFSREDKKFTYALFCGESLLSKLPFFYHFPLLAILYQILFSYVVPYLMILSPNFCFTQQLPLNILVNTEWYLLSCANETKIGWQRLWC